MVAYSFKRHFVGPIKAGLDPASKDGGAVYVGSTLHNPKRQTIRAVGRRRHARPGEILQLYCGLRSKQAFLIGRAKCTEVRDIVITFENGRDGVAIGGTEAAHGRQRYAFYHRGALDSFARRDGFDSWAEMRKFWEAEHAPLPKTWIGVMIEWEPLT